MLFGPNSMVMAGLRNSFLDVPKYFNVQTTIAPFPMTIILWSCKITTKLVASWSVAADPILEIDFWN